MSNNRNSFRYKSIRDPLYGFIGLSEEETKLIDTEIFGRLRGIKQLSHAYVAYPSAVHTRFEHSLGVAHIAGRMCDALQLNGEEKRLVRLAALLHDIGHGPFSHLFENVLQKINPDITKIHEKISRLIIENDSEIDSILGSDKKKIVELLSPSQTSTNNNKLSGYDKKKITDLFSQNDTIDNADKISLPSQIVSSSLDADRLDYLRRDSYHMGVAYGLFDLERILYTLRKAEGPYTSLAVDVKGKDALENYRIARYLMHVQVYEHHARLAADRMFLQALDVAIHKEKIIDRDMLKISSPQFLSFYKKLDDNFIYNLIMNDPNAHFSKTILGQIKRRKLLKRACQFEPKAIPDLKTKHRLHDMTQEELDAKAAEVAKDLGLKEHEIIFYKSDILMKLFGRADLLLLDDDKVYDMKEMSPIFTEGRVIEFYVFGPEDKTVRKRISRKIAGDFGILPDSEHARFLHDKD